MSHQVRWTDKKISQRIALIEPLVHRRRSAIAPFRLQYLSGPLLSPPVGADLDDSSWEVVEPRRHWGHWMTDFTLRTRFQVPGDWDASLPTALYLPLGEAGDFSHPEALAYIDGEPYAACDRHHQEIPAAAALAGRRRAPAGAARLDRHWRRLAGATRLPSCSCRPAALVQIDQPTRDFVAAARVALGIANTLDANEPGQGPPAQRAGRRPSRSSTPASRWAMRSTPASRRPRGAARRRRRGRPAAGCDHRRHRPRPHRRGLAVDARPDPAQGRAHLPHRAAPDGAVPRLPLHPEPAAALRLSCARTTRSSSRTSSSASPKAAGSRWAACGSRRTATSPAPSRWRASSCWGARFFREHFGPDAESPVLWLPDVFGYAWNLPQLIKQAGLDYFFTIKIGWNQYNRLPYDSFWWQGLDGTRVLTHFSTTPEASGYGVSTYNAKATPEQALGTWSNFQQKEPQNDLLDGLRLRRRRRRADPRDARERPRDGQLPGHAAHAPGQRRRLLPRAGARRPATACRPGTASSTWSCTAAPTPRRAATSAPTARASSCCTTPSSWPRWPRSSTRPTATRPTTCSQAWELVCLNQFHDIIPGSSIGPVYVESQQQYAEVQRHGQRRCATRRWQPLPAKTGGDVVVVNPTLIRAQRPGLLPGSCLQGGLRARRTARPWPRRPTDGGTLIGAGELPPYSVTPLRSSSAAARAGPAHRPARVSPAHPGERLPARRAQRRRRHHAHLRQAQRGARCCRPARSPTSSRPSRIGR